MMKKTLNIDKMDIERRIGLHGDYTSPHKLLAFLLAFSVTLGLSLALSSLPLDLQSSTPIAIITQRGWTPYATLLAFNWGVFLLILKSHKISVQNKAVRNLTESDFHQTNFSPETSATHLESLATLLSGNSEAFLIGSRINTALTTLDSLKDPAAVPPMIANHTENDEVQSDDSYAFPHMLLFLIPILGFIGTVIGLSQAIGGFGAALSVNSEDIANLIDSLQNVTGGLSVAFDTTLFALLCALVLQIITSTVRAREAKLFESCNQFMRTKFFPKLSKG